MTWTAVIGILIGAHHAFGFLGDGIVAEPTAEAAELAVQILFLTAVAIMTVISAIDMMDLALAQLGASFRSLREGGEKNK